MFVCWKRSAPVFTRWRYTLDEIYPFLFCLSSHSKPFFKPRKISTTLNPFFYFIFSNFTAIFLHVDSPNINSDQKKFSELNRSGFPRPQHEKDRKFNDYSEGIGHSVEAINRKYQASVRRNVSWKHGHKHVYAIYF